MSKIIFLNGYRLNQIKTDQINKLNWLFLPGGPGIGSDYLGNFAANLTLDGSIYLVDFPGDGSNRNTDDINFDSWCSGLLDMIENLKPCVLVTHSFSGMFALTIPELERMLAGLIIISSAPNNGWIQHLQYTIDKYNLPDIQKDVEDLYANQVDEQLKMFYKASIPYLFAEHETEQSKLLLQDFQYNVKTKIYADIHFHSTFGHSYVPENLPTMIIGSIDDRLLPIQLFSDSKEFKKSNVNIVELNSTGHFPWLSHFDEINDAFLGFVNKWGLYDDTTIIYLTGKPGVGKYTIAKELAANHGFIVCDNQLINNPIFELLQYDGYAKIPDFAWDTIARIRAEIFDFLITVPQNNYVLTNNLYEDEGDRALYDQVKKMAEARGSFFVPVRLLIDQDEHLRRVVDPKRRNRWKSIDPQDVHDETPLLSISHPHLFSLNVSNLSPEDAAEAIMNHIIELRL